MRHPAQAAGIGQNWSFSGAWRKVRLWIRKQTFDPIAAAQNDRFLSYLGFEISMRKQFVVADFVAS